MQQCSNEILFSNRRLWDSRKIIEMTLVCKPILQLFHANGRIHISEGRTLKSADQLKKTFFEHKFPIANYRILYYCLGLVLLKAVCVVIGLSDNIFILILGLLPDWLDPEWKIHTQKCAWPVVVADLWLAAAKGGLMLGMVLLIGMENLVRNKRCNKWTLKGT